MSDNDIQDAIDHLDHINNQSKVVWNAQSQISQMKKQLEWCKEAAGTNLPSSVDVIHKSEPFVQYVKGISLDNISIQCTDSGVAIGATVCNTVIHTVTSQMDEGGWNDESDKLRTHYQSLSSDSSSEDYIRTQLSAFDIQVVDQYDQAVKSYHQWQGGVKSESDLAKDMRNFIETFRGELNKLRVDKNKRNKEKVPKFAWGKMIRAIGKTETPNQRALKDQGKLHDHIWKALTRIMKEMSFKGKNNPSNEDLQQLWADFCDHLRAVMGLIDKTLI